MKLGVQKHLWANFSVRPGARLLECLRIILPFFLLGAFVNPIYAQSTPVGGVAPSSMANAKLKPKMVFPVTQFNFGQVAEGTEVRTDFLVRNDGDDNLIFQKVLPSCGCTIVSGLDKPLLPDAQTKVGVTFDTTGFNGSKVRTISIQTNDLEKPTQILTIKGTVSPRIAIEPQVVNFGEVTFGASQTRTLTVKALEPGIEFGEILLTDSAVSIKEKKRTKNEISVDVTLAGTVSLGEHRDRIVITTKGYREPSITIPLYAFVKGSIRIEPQQISFGLVPQSGLLRRRFKIENFGSEAMAISAIKSSHPSFSATIKDGASKKQYIVEVVLDPAKVTTDVRGSLTIETGVPKNPKITVPVYAIADAAK